MTTGSQQTAPRAFSRDAGRPDRRDRDPARAEGSRRQLDYTAFRIITERNVFNANRSGRSARGGQEPRRRPTRVDSFALVGILSYEKGQFAFFDGTSSEFRKVLQSEGTIAGYKIIGISQKGVKLEAAGKQIELPVNYQMRREDEGEWQVAVRSGSDTPSGPSSSASSGSSATATATATASPEVNEVLKKLMERREQEDKK